MMSLPLKQGTCGLVHDSAMRRLPLQNWSVMVVWKTWRCGGDDRVHAWKTWRCGGDDRVQMH